MNDSAESSASGARDSAIAILLPAIGLVALLILAWLGRVVLLLLFAGVLVAVLLTVIVDWIEAKLRLARGPTLLLTLIGACAFASLILWLSGPTIVEQFTHLQADLPQAAHQLVERVNNHDWSRWLFAQLWDYSRLSGNFSFALTRIGGIVLNTATVITGGVIITILGIYLAAEPEVYLAGLRHITPLRFRGKLDACAESVVGSLRWWLLAQILSMAAVGAIVALGLWLLGLPLAVPLGIIAALLTFIPNVGPVLSVVPAVVIGISISPIKGLLTILLFILVHFLEGNLIRPLLERQIVRLPPALTLVMQLLLAVVAGPLGLALAAPLTAAMLGILKVLLPAPAPDPAA